MFAVVEIRNIDKEHDERTDDAPGDFGGKDRLADNDASDEQIEHRYRGIDDVHQIIHHRALGAELCQRSLHDHRIHGERKTDNTHDDIQRLQRGEDAVDHFGVPLIIRAGEVLSGRYQIDEHTGPQLKIDDELEPLHAAPGRCDDAERGGGIGGGRYNKVTLKKVSKIKCFRSFSQHRNEALLP